MDNLVPDCHIEDDEEDDGRGDLGTDNLDLRAELAEPSHHLHLYPQTGVGLSIQVGIEIPNRR